MKILHVLEATGGGTRRHLRDLLTRLDPETFDLSFAAANRREAEFADDLELFRGRGIGVHILSARRGLSPFDDWKAYRQLAALMKAEHFDVVHTHSSKAGILGRFAAARSGVGVIVHTPHVFPFQMEDAGPIGKRLYHHLERAAARRTTHLVAVCEAEKRAAVEAGLLPSANITVVHNGIDVSEWNPEAISGDELKREFGLADKPFVVGVIGRFMAQKGHRFFVEAAKLVARRTDAHFLLVGDGPTKPSVRKAIRNQGLEDRFTLVGRRGDVERCYALCDLIALSSRWEACPYTLLEAMAMRKPVVATATGGVPEIIANGVDGRVIQLDDVDAFAEAIIALRQNRRAAAAMAAAARDKVASHFRREAMVRAHQELYARLVQ